MATYNSKNKLLSAVSYVISVARSRSVPNQSMRQCHTCLMWSESGQQLVP